MFVTVVNCNEFLPQRARGFVQAVLKMRQTGTIDGCGFQGVARGKRQVAKAIPDLRLIRIAMQDAAVHAGCLVGQIQPLITVGYQQVVPDVRSRHGRGLIQHTQDVMALLFGRVNLEQVGICPEIRGIQACDGFKLSRRQQRIPAPFDQGVIKQPPMGWRSGFQPHGFSCDFTGFGYPVQRDQIVGK